MQDYQWIYQRAVQRCGGEAELEARLPVPLSPHELLSTGDDRVLSTLCRRVFRAGLKHSLVDAKWPAFEEAFWGFKPEAVRLISDEQIDGLMHNSALIRHLAKLKAVRVNAQMIYELAQQNGSAVAFLVQWPDDDLVGLWRYLAKQGAQLGGNSAPYFLRMLGRDTFMLTDDVVSALIGQEIIDKKPTSQKALRAVQEAFNHWQNQSGRPFCQLSVMLAHTVNWP